MRWSWKIATVRGIGIYVHATFLLLVAWLLFLDFLQGHTLGTALRGIGFVLLLFLCVLLHELGHALTAQRFGVRTRDITLYPIGGVARLERIPRVPRQELVIALAGPAVNIAIAALLALGLWLGLGEVPGAWVMLFPESNLLARLLWVNLLIVGFNLLPAFPMDGGRVLRALLAERMEYGRATRIAAGVGQAMAFLFGFVGLMGNPFLLFIALFVYLGAAQEAQMVQTELAFRGVPTREAMMTNFSVLSPEEPLSLAVERLLAGAQQDFPVVADGEVVGLLTRTRLVEALGRCGPECPVREAMLPAPPAATPEESLEATFQRMREAEIQSLPVLQQGRLVGLITLENIGEFLMLREAVEQLVDGGAAAVVEEAEQEIGRRSWRAWLYRRAA